MREVLTLLHAPLPLFETAPFIIPFTYILFPIPDVRIVSASMTYYIRPGRLGTIGNCSFPGIILAGHTHASLSPVFPENPSDLITMNKKKRYHFPVLRTPCSDRAVHVRETQLSCAEKPRRQKISGLILHLISDACRKKSVWHLWERCRVSVT